MRIPAGIPLCIGFTLVAAAASADTYYKYRDKNTGRDVFVNRLDQVPRKVRGQAKIVLETDAPAAEPAQEPPVEIIEPPTKTGRPTIHDAQPASPSGEDLRAALAGKNLWRDGPALASAAVDAKLAKAGAPSLTGAERGSLGSLLITIVVASIVAGLAALVAWIVILVTAVRDGRLWWALCIFLFSPLAYVYLFLHAGKDRALFKTLCAFGMLSPALVGLVGAWRFYAWFHAVIQARGGRI
jgi:hypothetical protein